MADSLLHEVSKAALCVSQCRDDGIIGHDVILMVRSSFYLFLFELAGEAGVIAALDAEETDKFMTKTMEVPTVEMVTAAKQLAGASVVQPLEMEHKPEQKTAAAKPEKFCKNCGKPIQADAQFCPHCGNTISRRKQEVTAQKPVNADACPHCGKPIRPGAKFCRNCGKQL